MTETQGLILDVRPMIPMMRHRKIFRLFDALEPGEALILINDHEPKALYQHFTASWENRFSWNVLEEGPEVWRVRIERTA